MTFSFRVLLICLLTAGIVTTICAQPRIAEGGVMFSFASPVAKRVSLVGDFNGWSRGEDTLRQDAPGHWSIVKHLVPGIFQYKFVVDDSSFVNDPGNPVVVTNYNNSGTNSVFVMTDENTILLTADPPAPRVNPRDEYPAAPDRKPLYLNIIWHQHQPLYADPEKDQLTGPWVRTHATKDYYDMAAILRKYPDVHCNINLTSSLLLQLLEFYVDRLRPFVNTSDNTINAAAFLRKWKGKTDPWIDLALKPAAKYDSTDKAYLYQNVWNAFGMSEVMMERFPEYLALKSRTTSDRSSGGPKFSTQEMREIIFWFYLANFDPDFLLGPVTLEDGSICDLSGYLERKEDGKFYLKKKVTDADCRRMVAEAYKVMANVVPIHRALRYSPAAKTGQIDVITTPYYHPILPLIYDSDLAKICQPADPLPPRYSYPEDASAQVAKAVVMYTRIFGAPPTGMWPGEGSVAQPVLSVLRANGILWSASDVKVLTRSTPQNQPNTTPYQFPAAYAGHQDATLALVFRDTELSDRIGFKYQNYKGEEAAEDFIRTILSRAPSKSEPDGMITVILDGENAWEWYRKDVDGKEFLNAFYRKLTSLFASRRVITTTMMEYIEGNPSRGIAPHPINALPAMERVWPGSWINANYDTWIGEPEENQAWTYLLRARQDLGGSSIAQPDPKAPAPKAGTKAWYGYKAWEEMYAAEGSDWFWWYGADQTAPAGDKPFDTAYLLHLNNIYAFANRAGAKLPVPKFDPIITDDGKPAQGQGTMAQSRTECEVVFRCDARNVKVERAIFIAGNLPVLGGWQPNTIAMYDDGTHGDTVAGDGIWSLKVSVPVGEEIQYKFTNSGKQGVWVPGEEFPSRHRSRTIEKKTDSPLVITDIFGKD